MGNTTNQERERRRQTQEALLGLAILMILLPVIIKAITGIIKCCIGVIKAVIMFLIKKPKIAIPLYSLIACVAGGLYYWYNSPEQILGRAKDCPDSAEKMQMLEEVANKNYIPGIMYYADLCSKNGNFSKSYSLYSQAADLENADALYKKGCCL